MKWFVFLPVLTLMAGCGTVRNISPPPGADWSHAANVIYGGVHDDVELVRHAFSDVKRFPSSEQSLAANLKDVLVHSADLPASAIGDTLTLNMVIVNNYARRRREIRERTADATVSTSADQ